MTFKQRLLSASMILSIMLLLGRVAGFAREIQLGALFGVSREGDFAIVMLTTPDLLVNLLLAGGLSAALIPEFSRLNAAGRARLFRTSSLYVGALFGLIALLVLVFPSILIFAFAPGYVGANPAEYEGAFRLAALAIPLAGLVGVTSALLNSEEKFFVVGSATLIFNIAIIAVLGLWWSPQNGLLVLAAAIATASVLRYVSQMLAAGPHLLAHNGTADVSDMADLTRRFLQALGASTLVLLVPVVLRAVLSLNGAGNIAAFNFATKLVELPIGIAITTISVAAFPAMSKALVAGDEHEARRLFAEGLTRAVSIGSAIAVPCIWFAEPLTGLVFGHGQMDAEALVLVADLARLGFLTLPLVAVSSMAAALLNARRRTGLLLVVTLACLALLPMAFIPGMVQSDVRLTVAALPLFHLAYAMALARVTDMREPGIWRRQALAWLRLGLVSTGVTAAFALIAQFGFADMAYIRLALALAATGTSVLAVSALTRQARVI